MGFWPYFLQAQESDGGEAFSPFSLGPSKSLIGTETILLCMAFLLLFGEEVEAIFISLEGDDSGPLS